MSARILVIDDMLGVRKSIVTVLRQEGYNVDEAENGVIGLAKAQAATYDLIITDMLMPEKDGLGVLMSLSERGNLVPVLAISGGGATVDSKNVLTSAGKIAQATLAKPFHKPQLMEAVRSLLAASR